eukprot:240077_1
MEDCLLIQKARDIIVGNHNVYDNKLLLNGYIRQNTNHVYTEQNIKDLCKSYLGSIHLVIIDKIKHKIHQKQTGINNKLKEVTKQQKLAKYLSQQTIETEEQIIRKRNNYNNFITEIEEEIKQINKRKQIVEQELSEAKSEIIVAQKLISNINRNQLNEIKSLKNPPKMVQIVFYATCNLLKETERKQKLKKTAPIYINTQQKLVYGFVRLSFYSNNFPIEVIDLIFKCYFIKQTIRIKKIQNWKQVQKMLKSKDFIPKILKFDVNLVTTKIRKKINKNYLSNEHFTFSRVNKASKTAGPLVLWIKSQIKFAHLLDMVEPMKKEIEELKHNLDVKQKLCGVLKDELKELEIRNKQNKFEYEMTIEKIDELMINIGTVKDCNKYETLLQELNCVSDKQLVKTEI